MIIYKCTNIKTGKCYIGQTIQNLDRRRCEHLSHSRNSSKDHHFHNALRKYGEKSFVWEVIDVADNINQLNDLEEFYIKKFNSISKGYNIREGGNNLLHSKESKEKMSESQRKAHARRRANGTDTFTKTRKTKGWKWNDEQKEKLKPVQKKLKKMLTGKTWKVIDGKRVWMEKE